MVLPPVRAWCYGWWMDDHYTKEERAKLRVLLVEPVDFIALERFVTELLDEIETARDMALERKEERD